jgi:hypothetical protein
VIILPSVTCDRKNIFAGLGYSLMENRQIIRLKELVKELQAAPLSERAIGDIMHRYGLPVPAPGMDSLRDKCISLIHADLQTALMAEACESARRSSRWAAVATISAAVSAIGAVAAVLLQLNT